jgi:DNA-directed RNA polymerase specialized sigma24 family protein
MSIEPVLLSRERHPMTAIAVAAEPPDDNECLAFLDFCRQLSRAERIAVVKTYRPKWTVRQIAQAVGVSKRTLIRSPAYRRLRQIDESRPNRKSKYRGRTRRRIDPPPDERGFSDPDDPDA